MTASDLCPAASAPSKKQITLPVEVMRSAGLHPGDEVAIEALADGEIGIAARGSRARHRA